MERKKNYLYQGIAWLTILLLTVGSFRIKEIVEAITADPLIEANVVYNEDQTQASIVFDLASVNQGTNEIVKITSEREGEVVYDASLINRSSDYDVAENGNYQFTVTYRSTSLLTNQSDATSVESEALETTQVNVQVDGIQPTPETSSSEQTPTIDSEGDVEAPTIETSEGALSTEESETVSSTNVSQEQTEASATDETTTSTEASQVEAVNETPAKESKATTAYPQEILFRGVGFYGDNRKVQFTIDPTTYKMTGTVIQSGGGYHEGFKTTYYTITVYKKDAKLGDQGQVLFNVVGTDTPKKEDFKLMEDFTFEEGDMLQIWSAEAKFNFVGSPVIASDGVSRIDYSNNTVSKEKYQNSVYQLTKDGLKEVYNQVPTINGQNIPLYSVYGEGNWTDGDFDAVPVYTDIIFKDDRNENGIYENNGYIIKQKSGNMTYSVTNLPESSKASGAWTSMYTIVDSWGRKTTANRSMVKLPKIDQKLTITEMQDKIFNNQKVEGFVHFEGAKVNTSSQTITLKSGTIIDATLGKSVFITVPYDTQTTTSFTKDNNGDLQGIQVLDKYTLANDVIKTATIGSSKNVTIATTYAVTLSETEIVTFDESGLKEKVKSQIADAMSLDATKLADAEIVFGGSFDRTNPKEGEYDVTVRFANGNATVDQVVTLNVTANPWSYDTPERTETNGASGFVVIPKGINLQRDTTDASQLSATTEVYFANYANATGVQYRISVDQTFEMMNVLDISNKFTVTATSKNGQPGTNNNRLNIGNLTSTSTQGKGLNVTFTASAEQVDKTKGRWQGNVHFYIERQ